MIIYVLKDTKLIIFPKISQGQVYTNLGENIKRISFMLDWFYYRITIITTKEYKYEPNN